MEKNNKFRAIRQDGLIDRTGSYIGQAHRIGRTYRTRRLDEKLQDIIETRERTFEYTFEDPFFYMNRLLFRPSLASLYEGTFSIFFCMINDSLIAYLSFEKQVLCLSYD